MILFHVTLRHLVPNPNRPWLDPIIEGAETVVGVLVTRASDPFSRLPGTGLLYVTCRRTFPLCRTIVLLVVVLATGVGVAAWEGLSPKEPVYHGRRLSYWVVCLGRNGNNQTKEKR